VLLEQYSINKVPDAEEKLDKTDGHEAVENQRKRVEIDSVVSRAVGSSPND